MHSLREKLVQVNLKFERQYPRPRLVYQQRGTAASTAWLQVYEVRLNLVLLMEDVDTFINEVVSHELAYLLVWEHFGRVPPHGKKWKWMMESILGVPARRTHQSELQSVQYGTFTCHYKCREYQLTAHRHNRVVCDEATYRCIHCGEPLVTEQSPELSGTFLTQLIAYWNNFRYVVGPS